MANCYFQRGQGKIPHAPTVQIGPEDFFLQGLGQRLAQLGSNLGRTVKYNLVLPLATEAGDRLSGFLLITLGEKRLGSKVNT